MAESTYPPEEIKWLSIRLHLSAGKSLLRIYFENHTNETREFKLDRSLGRLYLNYLAVLVDSDRRLPYQSAISIPRGLEHVILRPGKHRALRQEVVLENDRLRIGSADYDVRGANRIEAQFNYYSILSNVVRIR